LDHDHSKDQDNERDGEKAYKEFGSDFHITLIERRRVYFF
jgi:hypothetical protein